MDELEGIFGSLSLGILGSLNLSSATPNKPYSVLGENIATPISDAYYKQTCQEK